MGACTAEQHVFAGWILGTPCQCGAQRVVFRPELNVVRAEGVAPPAPHVTAFVVTPAAAADTVEAQVAADAVQAEAGADQEAEDALGPRRGRKR